jgi:hypothetical protein
MDEGMAPDGESSRCARAPMRATGPSAERPAAEEPPPTGDLLARTARAVAAADEPEQALAPILAAVRECLGAGGVAVLRAEGGRLAPAATDGLPVAERPMDEAALTPGDGGGYPLVLGGRVEGVLLVTGVAPERLAAQEGALAALVDLAAVALRAARRGEERGRERRHEEIRSLERLAATGTTATAAALGLQSLRAAQPDEFATLAQRYGEVLDQALEQRAFRADHRLPEQLRALANRLGFLKAGPRDVVELHSAALKGRLSGAAAQKAQAYVEEARVVVLELMGYLAAYYREHAIK